MTHPADLDRIPLKRLTPLSEHFPAAWRERLVDAGHRRDHVAIDAITDAMAQAGLVRPRAAFDRRFASVAADARTAAA